MTEEAKTLEDQLKAFAAELTDLKSKIADMDGNVDSDQEKAKKKLYKQRGADTNDPNPEDETGDNPYDNDDINQNVDDQGTNKQVKPKPSPKQKPSQTIAAELEKLQAEIDSIRKAPVIENILKAKSDLGLITNETRDAESKKLSELTEEQLKQVNDEFTKIATAKANSTPFVRYQSAAVNQDGSRGKTADSFIKEAILTI